jgi:hypothetical protein
MLVNCPIADGKAPCKFFDCRSIPTIVQLGKADEDELLLDVNLQVTPCQLYEHGIACSNEYSPPLLLSRTAGNVQWVYNGCRASQFQLLPLQALNRDSNAVYSVYGRVQFLAVCSYALTPTLPHDAHQYIDITTQQICRACTDALNWQRQFACPRAIWLKLSLLAPIQMLGTLIPRGCDTRQHGSPEIIPQAPSFQPPVERVPDTDADTDADTNTN